MDTSNQESEKSSQREAEAELFLLVGTDWMPFAIGCAALEYDARMRARPANVWQDTVPMVWRDEA